MALLSVLGAALNPATWPATVWVLLLTTFALIVARNNAHPALPKNAPAILKGWPILGVPEFFGKRWDFMRETLKKTADGTFSFYYGPHPIVAMSGTKARTSFFASRGLHMGDGYAALFIGQPTVKHLDDREVRFETLFKKFTNKANLEANLPYLVRDTDAAFARIDASKPLDPFKVMHRLIYQLTHHTLGSRDIAENPVLLDQTLAIYSGIDGTSAFQVMFPWLPTVGKFRKMWGGMRLHMLFSKIIKDRRKAGTKETDAMQVMVDAGDDELQISIFIIGALFAGLFNSGVNAAWLTCFFANDKELYTKVRNEVDGAVAKYRKSDEQTASEVLQSLSYDAWATEFPFVELCVRESIRMVLPGSMMRKNTSGEDIEISGTNKVIPKDTYAVYPIADAHFNPAIYTEPEKFDPARYLPDRAEDKKEPHAYLGWGSGMHPCLGMRFAKLEMAMATAMFMARFDYEFCEKDGSAFVGPMPAPEINLHGSWPAFDKLFLKLTPRS